MYGISDSSGIHIIQGVGSIKSCARSTRTRKGRIRGLPEHWPDSICHWRRSPEPGKSYLAGLEGFFESPTLKEASLVLQQHWPSEQWQPTEVGERRDVDFSMDLSDFGNRFLAMYCTAMYLPKQEEYEEALSFLEKSARLKNFIFQIRFLPNYPFQHIYS